MKIGTRSILYGYHQFILHPLLVALAWWRIYRFPLDPRLWVAFFVHDLGYWGKPNMDGPEGEAHVWTGAKIMGWLFDAKDTFGRKIVLRSRVAAVIGPVFDFVFGRCPQGMTWYCFTFYHSRFIAKRYGTEPSKLCVADKGVIAFTPTWIQLSLMNLTGEIREYMQHDGRNGRSSGLGMTQWQWAGQMRGICKKFVKDKQP